MLDAIALQLVRVGRDKDFVSSDLRGDDLADDVFVGEANDEAVFGSIIFVFGLSDETFPGIVIGLSLATSFVLGLESASKIVSKVKERRVDKSTYSRRCS